MDTDEGDDVLMELLMRGIAISLMLLMFRQTTLYYLVYESLVFVQKEEMDFDLN